MKYFSESEMQDVKKHLVDSEAGNEFVRYAIRAHTRHVVSIMASVTFLIGGILGILLMIILKI